MIAFSLSKEGELAIDYAFKEYNMDEFARLFALIHTGVLCEPMCQLVIQNMIKEENIDDGNLLLYKLREGVVEIMKEKGMALPPGLFEDEEEDEDSPVVDPTCVFRSAPNEE